MNKSFFGVNVKLPDGQLGVILKIYFEKDNFQKLSSIGRKMEAIVIRVTSSGRVDLSLLNEHFDFYKD